jgi:hypothetical protein
MIRCQKRQFSLPEEVLVVEPKLLVRIADPTTVFFTCSLLKSGYLDVKAILIG